MQEVPETPSLFDSCLLPIGVHTGAGIAREYKIRPMVGRDRKLLTSPSVQGNPAKLVTALIASCVERIDDMPMNEKLARSLYAADRDYLMVHLATISTDPITSITVQCPMCRAESDADIDMRKLPVTSLSHAETQVGVVMTTSEGRLGYPIEGPGDVKGRIRLLTGEELERVAQSPSRNAQDVVFRILCASVVSLNGQPLTERTLDEMSLPMLDWLASCLRQYEVGVNTQVDVTCSGCGIDVPYMLDVADFFVRSARKKPGKTS